MSEFEGRLPNGETPYWGFGWLKIRLPFIHYKWSIPETLIGIVLCFVYFAAKPLLVKVLGMTPAQANTVIVIQLALYCLHALCGDPLVAGWVSAMIPLILGHLTQYAPGVDRVYSLVAIQLWIGILCLGLGVTGLAKPVVRKIPISIRAGIILGAGIAAMMQVFYLTKNPRFFMNFPIGLLGGVGICCLLVWSNFFKVSAKTNKALKRISAFGLPIAFVASAVLATVTGEIPMPKIVWGFTPFDFSGVIQGFTVFGIGLPPMKIFLAAFPMSALVYVALYGDIIFGDELIKLCDKVRTDEKVIPDPNRVHFITGIRNLLSCCLGVTPTMAGPYWTPLTAIIVDRYMRGRAGMDSIFSGFGSVAITFFIAAFFAPVWSLFGQSMAVILALCFVAVAFVAAYVALRMTKYVQQNITMILTALLIAFQDPIIALATGFAAYFVLEWHWKKESKFEDPEVTLFVEKTLKE